MPRPLVDITERLDCGAELSESETEQELIEYFGVNESDLDMENYYYEDPVRDG